jgi:TetR/AcrR family transcriptional regulator
MNHNPTPPAIRPKAPRKAATPIATSAGTPPPAVRGQGRNEILEAALRAFASHGFDGATLPDIARTAQIGHPLIHYHFGSKDNLWRSVVDYAFADLAASYRAIAEASTGLAPIDVLRVMCRSFAVFVARHPDHAALIVNEVRCAGDRFDWLVETHLRPLHAHFDAVIAMAHGAGAIKPIPAASLTSMLIGAATQFFTGRPLIARLYGAATADDAQTHIDWIVDVILHGIVPAPQLPTPNGETP